MMVLMRAMLTLVTQVLDGLILMTIVELVMVMVVLLFHGDPYGCVGDDFASVVVVMDEGVHSAVCYSPLFY